MNKTIFFTGIIFSLLFIPIQVYAQNTRNDLAGGHRGNINSLIHNGDTVLSAGDDGFLVTWNIQQRRAINRFQLTTYKIQSMVKHPIKNEICIIETSNLNTYKLSVWDYTHKQKLFTILLEGPFTFSKLFC